MKETDTVSIFTNTVKIDKIKEFMKKKNLSEGEFAQKCHIKLEELEKILDNYSDFEPIWLLRIARYMNVEFADLANDA